MVEPLSALLRIAGAGLILLAIGHVPIGRHLGWREDSLKLSPANASIFHVHTFFICLVLVLMGLPCLLDPAVFLEPSRAGLWLSSSIGAFWLIRLYCQFFVYRADLWRGRKMETMMHIAFTFVWTALFLLFAACSLRQAGWLH